MAWVWLRVLRLKPRGTLSFYFRSGHFREHLTGEYVLFIIKREFNWNKLDYVRNEENGSKGGNGLWIGGGTAHGPSVIMLFTFLLYFFHCFRKKDKDVLYFIVASCRAYVISVGNTTSQMFFQVKCTNGWMVVEQCQKIHLEQCLILGE